MALDPEFKAYFEHVDKRFDDLAEIVAANREKLDATFEAVGELKEGVVELKINVSALREDVGVLKVDVSALKEDVGVLKEDMVEVKSELGLIRNDLKAKADRSELQLLEQRVIRLERRMATT